MTRNDLQGNLDLLVLKTLSQIGSLHGYGIVLHIQRASDELLRVEEGSLYPAHLVIVALCILVWREPDFGQPPYWGWMSKGQLLTIPMIVIATLLAVRQFQQGAVPNG